MNNRIAKNKLVLFATLLVTLALVAAFAPAARASPTSNSLGTRAMVNAAGDEYWSSLGNSLLSIIYTIAQDSSGTLYAGGGVTSPYLSKWNGATWSAVGGGMGGAPLENPIVYALLVDGSNNLYAGGGFTTAGGVPAIHIAKWNGITWSPLGTGIGVGSRYAYVDALVLDGSGNLYAGGYFLTAGSVSAKCIAKWDGTNWSALGTGMDSTVHALLLDGSGNLYAGGEFTTAGGTSANSIAKWNGVGWSPIGGTNGIVYTLALDASRQYLYVGGLFSTAGGVSASNIAKWDVSTNTWSALGSGVDDTVHALALDASGNLFAGGEFRTAGGANVQHVAQWNPTTNSWSGLGSGTDGWVFALLLDRVSPTPALYVGGQFANVGGKHIEAIAMWSPPSTSTFKLHLPLILR